MTSPQLNAKPRSEEEAMFDVKDARHRIWLGRLLERLKEENGEDWELWPKEYCEAVSYTIDQLDKNAAARILERNKSQ